MRIVAILAALLLLAAGIGCRTSGAEEGAAGPLQGSWEEVVFRGAADVPYSVFTLELSVRDGEIEGRYCFVTRHGKKIDCDPESAGNIRGHLLDDREEAEVSFHSFFGGRNGRAHLVIEAETLHWTVEAPPVGGPFYGPMSAKLSRTNSAIQ